MVGVQARAKGSDNLGWRRIPRSLAHGFMLGPPHILEHSQTTPNIQGLPGEYSDEGAALCLPCPAGTYIEEPSPGEC